MIVAELVSRVTLLTLLAILTVTVAAGVVAGITGAAGAAAGGAIALLNFRWLARGAASALRGGRGRSLGLVAVGLRYLATFGALALVLSTGWAHPLAVVVGLSVLPPVLIAHGLERSGG